MFSDLESRSIHVTWGPFRLPCCSTRPLLLPVHRSSGGQDRGLTGQGSASPMKPRLYSDALLFHRTTPFNEHKYRPSAVQTRDPTGQGLSPFFRLDLESFSICTACTQLDSHSLLCHRTPLFRGVQAYSHNTDSSRFTSSRTTPFNGYPGLEQNRHNRSVSSQALKATPFTNPDSIHILCC